MSDGKEVTYAVGFDSHEIIAHEICKFTCLEKASVPVKFIKLANHVLRDKGIYQRPRDKKQNTEFTYLRFLVPYLAGYKVCDVLYALFIVRFVSDRL